jgi:hypothetical protein
VKRKAGWIQRHEQFVWDRTALAIPVRDGVLRCSHCGRAGCPGCMPPAPAVTVFACGDRERCRNGQPHSWDGVPLEDGLVSSSTCSICGIAAIDVDLMVGP